MSHGGAHVLLPSVRVNIHPDRAEFHRLAREHTVVPVWTELLADFETPVAAFAKLDAIMEIGARAPAARAAEIVLAAAQPRAPAGAGAIR